MSARSTTWSSWVVRGYWLHLYRVSTRTGYRYGLALESDRSGRTFVVCGARNRPGG